MLENKVVSSVILEVSSKAKLDGQFTDSVEVSLLMANVFHSLRAAVSNSLSLLVFKGVCCFSKMQETSDGHTFAQLIFCFLTICDCALSSFVS